MARRLPRLLIPVAIVLVAMVLAFWAVSPSQAQENPAEPPPGTVPAVRDLPVPAHKLPPLPYRDVPNGPKDCGSCANDDPH